MLARVRSAAVLGIDAYLVEVETDIANGLPTFVTVGLPQGAVKEGRDRVSAAMANTGYTFPLKRVTINLAPADIKKEGSAFDLPIALGIGAGGEARRPLGLAVVGGLLVSQTLTLYVTPVFYVYMESIQDRLKRRKTVKQPVLTGVATAK